MEKREFKVGDKVKIPKTKSEGISINDDRIQRHLANSKFDYMTIKHIYSDKTLVGVIHTEMEGEQNWNFKAEDLEHYEDEFVLPKCWFVLYNSQEEFDIINNFYGKVGHIVIMKINADTTIIVVSAFIFITTICPTFTIKLVYDMKFFLGVI